MSEEEVSLVVKGFCGSLKAKGLAEITARYGKSVAQFFDMHPDDIVEIVGISREEFLARVNQENDRRAKKWVDIFLAHDMG